MKEWIEETIREKIESIIYDKVVTTITSDQATERLVALFEPLETEIKRLKVVREAAEKVDWEGIILLVDEYPAEVVKLRELQQALVVKLK